MSDKPYTMNVGSIDEFFDTNKFPHTVYKFRDWGVSFHRDILNGNFYLSSPLQFNDPFDCNIPVAYQLLRNNPQLQQEYFTDFVSRTKSHFSPEQKTNLINQLIQEAKFNSDDWLNDVANTTKENFGSHGVFCLTRTKENLLLWSHYANCHKGFCVGFNTVELYKEMLIKHKIAGADVDYAEDYPLLSPMSSFPLQLKIQISCKSHDWKYEEETRLFKMFGANKKYEVSLSIIREINLGCKVSSEHKAEILEFVAKNLPHVQIFQAKQMQGTFKLKFEQLR